MRTTAVSRLLQRGACVLPMLCITLPLGAIQHRRVPESPQTKRCTCHDPGCRTGCAQFTPPTSMSPPPSRRLVHAESNGDFVGGGSGGGSFLLSPPPRSRRSSATPLRPNLKKGYYGPGTDISNGANASAMGVFSDDESDDGRDSSGGGDRTRGSAGESDDSPDWASRAAVTTIQRNHGAVWKPYDASSGNSDTAVGGGGDITMVVAGQAGTGGRGGGGGGDDDAGTGWVVLVQRCFVVVSCHALHPALFKVLRVIADAERNKCSGGVGGGPPAPPSSSPAASASAPGRNTDVQAQLRESRFAGMNAAASRATAAPAAGGVVSPYARRGATAAAADADRDLSRSPMGSHHAAAGGNSINGGGDVVLHYPPYDRMRLDCGLGVPLELWSSALALSMLPAENVVRAVNVLLLEKCLVVLGRDLGLVSVTATALLSLLRPFEWEGVFVPVLPTSLLDVLQSPVPVVVGLQAPFDADDPRLHSVVVLDLDAPAVEDQFHMASMTERLPICKELCDDLQKANKLGRRRGIVGDGGGKKASSSMRYGAGVHALAFMSGLTAEERKSVLKMRALIRAHVVALCGDLAAPGGWRRYGALNAASGEFEFYPAWFTEPIERQLQFQTAVAHSQMMVSFVDRCRCGEIDAAAAAAAKAVAAGDE
ncbi:unnamed protein product, partial [Phaeothamnion confervicola]